MKNTKTQAKTEAQVKSFKDVEKYDVVIMSDFETTGNKEEVGIVIWKGTLAELLNSPFKFLADTDDFEEVSSQMELEEYDWVAVETHHGQRSNLVLFNYSNDPCGVVVLQS